MKRIIVRNKKADVLGLPMYLIIIMVVAVAVIAAVIAMMPQGTSMMNASISPGVITVDETTGEQLNSETITILLTSRDERADPIAGATVTLVGAGGAQNATTDSSGTATLSFTSLSLESNVNEAYLKLTATASGYEDYTKENAVLVYRP